METKQMTDVETELAKIANKNDGVLRPKDVVDFARSESTALHSRFEWDDSLAAEEWRLVQARQIIRIVVTTVKNGDSEPVRLREYVSLTSDRGGDSYRPLSVVMNNHDMREQLLKDAKKALGDLMKKYRELKELAAVWREADKVI